MGRDISDINCCSSSLRELNEAFAITELKVARLTKDDKEGSQGTSQYGKSSLAHSHVDQGDGHGSQEGRECAKSNVRDVVVVVFIANVVKEKVSVVSDKVAHCCQHHLGQWRMDIEEIAAAKVVRGELSKVNLIESIPKEKRSVVSCQFSRSN